jgi:hypothetical protein
MMLKHLSLSALAGFVFAGSLIASAGAAPVNACTACWQAYDRCNLTTATDCETKLIACQRRNNCPV